MGMTIEEIREFFKEDVFSTEAAGIVIEEAGLNYSKCSMPLDRRHMNANGGVMGGAIFTLADFTFAVAANVDNVPTVSLSSSITYLAAPRGKKLVSEAKMLHSGRTTCAFNVFINDEDGTPVATVVFSGFKKSPKK